MGGGQKLLGTMLHEVVGQARRRTGPVGFVRQPEMKGSWKPLDLPKLE